MGGLAQLRVIRNEMIGMFGAHPLNTTSLDCVSHLYSEKGSGFHCETVWWR